LFTKFRQKLDVAILHELKFYVYLIGLFPGHRLLRFTDLLSTEDKDLTNPCPAAMLVTMWGLGFIILICLTLWAAHSAVTTVKGERQRRKAKKAPQVKPFRKKRLTLRRFYFLNLFVFIPAIIVAVANNPGQRIVTNFAEWGPQGQAVVNEKPTALFSIAVFFCVVCGIIFACSVVWFIWDCLRNIFGGISQAINPEPPTYFELPYDAIVQTKTRGNIPWGDVQVGEVILLNGVWRPILHKTGLINPQA
jgi:magnesium-transporting ATPase (P-type)